MNTTPESPFAGFHHEAATLSAYIFSIDIFIISLKGTEDLVRYQPADPEAFQHWLETHGVRNVNATLGKMVHDYYFGKKKKK